MGHPVLIDFPFNGYVKAVYDILVFLIFYFPKGSGFGGDGDHHLHGGGGGWGGEGDQPGRGGGGSNSQD